MRNIKILTTFFVAFVLLFSFSSCEKQTATEKQVTVKINNVTQLLKKGTVTPDNPNDEVDVPTCSNLDPDYVDIILTTDPTDPGNQAYHTEINGLEVIEDNEGITNVVMELTSDEGEGYWIVDFRVYDENEELLWVAPGTTSSYVNMSGGAITPLLLDLNNPDIVVGAFTKQTISVDVLCWEAYSYKEYGFYYFDYDKFKARSLCFFGDIKCYPYDENWFTTGVYNNQHEWGWDREAIFMLIMKKETAPGVWEEINRVNDLLNPEFDGTPWYGEDDPLCIEYVDDLGVQENFKVEIHLVTKYPESGYVENYELVYVATFSDDYVTALDGAGPNFTTIDAEIEGQLIENFGFKDGVFYFDWTGCECDVVEGCETAWAMFDTTWENGAGTGYVFEHMSSYDVDYTDFTWTDNPWGWGTFYTGNTTFTVPLYAGAAKNNWFSKGTHVGDLTLTYSGDALVTIEYQLKPDYTFEPDPNDGTRQAQVYVDYSDLGSSSPGDFNYKNTNLENTYSDHTYHIWDISMTVGNGLWIMAHTSVCGPFPVDDVN